MGLTSPPFGLCSAVCNRCAMRDATLRSPVPSGGAAILYGGDGGRRRDGSGVRLTDRAGRIVLARCDTAGGMAGTGGFCAETFGGDVGVVA